MADPDGAEDKANRPLTGWKAIAGYFGKDERTVRRWAATRDLPVHRVKGERSSSVFAYAADLNRWLVSHGHGVETPPVGPAPRRPFPNRWLAALGAICVVLGLAGALGWRLLQPEARVQPGAAVSSAESLYLDGLYHLETRTADGIARSLGLFTQTIAADPGFAPAYVGLADAWNLVSQYTPARAEESYPKARAAAERAIALDPQNGPAYAALGFNTFYHGRDPQAAMALMEKSIALSPANARAHHWYALIAMQNRDFDVALDQIAIAQRLDPHAPSILANKALILFHAGQVQAALDILHPLGQSVPALLSPPAYLATIYLATGQDSDFLRAYRLAAEISDNRPALAIATAAETGFRAGGRQEMLRRMFAEQQRRHAQNGEPAFKLALTAAMMGDDAAALDFLEQSLRRGEPDIVGIRLEPALAGLRDDARYQALVAMAGFSPGD
ncbi:hypothetical protein MIC97_21795 [Aquamicrobium sp. NLF2-7]|uniref:tetratricopeptide repeat protein n=1 Tax=Aquamicrobium sp. NLF2-7 TaxID=2918753 RepID=UPI001EFB9CA9|nr:hypothetical protein [Aquamicrobium sp. NLF2-7]MCG8274119.1 hypothetical protein [Aquamicrobium sp. NLF2-7]